MTVHRRRCTVKLQGNTVMPYGKSATTTATVVVIATAANEAKDKNENPSTVSAKSVVTHIKTSFSSSPYTMRIEALCY